MALCNVTGTVYLPSGAIAANRRIVFRREVRNITAEYLGAMFPDDVITTTSATGEIDVNLVTGRYIAFATGSNISFFGVAVVPDAATANFADILNLDDIPDTPPVWYQQALDARDASTDAADQAKEDRAIAAQARDEAQQYADAAAQTAQFYDTIAEGRSAVADGEQFGVISGGSDGLTRPTIYRRDSASTQTLIVKIVASTEVDTEITERRSLVRGSTIAGYAVVVMDAAGNATWMAARASDGAPPDWVIDHLVDRMQSPLGVPDLADAIDAETATRRSLARIGAAPGLVVSIIDPDERLTWLAASAADGGMPPWVAEHVAERTAPYLSLPGASILASDRVLVGGTVVPVLPDMTRMAGWGSSTMEYMGSEVSAAMAGLGVAYYNGGDGGVRAEHTLAQMGAVPALLTLTGGSIPASGSVTVTSSNMPANVYLRAYTGTLAGVAGAISSTADAITFSRAADGAAVAVAADTPFVPTVGPQYQDAVTILNIGKNNFGSSIAPNSGEAIAALTDQAFAWLSPLVKRVVVMGHAVNRDTPAVSTLRDRVMDCNALLAATYGNLFFDLQGYMTGPQIWIDSGVTPTQADLDAQAAGNKPPSLSLDDQHFNAAGDAAIAKALRRFVVNLGWYKEPIV